MRDVVRLFLEDCPVRLAAIRAAITAGDMEALRTAAHALRGAAGTLSASGLVEAASVLERIGAEKRTDGCGGGVEDIERARRRSSRLRCRRWKERPRMPDDTRLRALVADDDRVTATVLAASLRRWNFDVVMAHNGEEAWDAIRGPIAPSLAILDWMMPGRRRPDALLAHSPAA